MAADLFGHVDGFDPISLPELESHAGLQMRVDRKYIVSYETLEQLLAELGDDYLALEIDGERLQQYDSVYFDTPELTGYRHHMQGRRKRFKCRTRLYGGTACFFDVKLKGKRGETVKSRLPPLPWPRLARFRRVRVPQATAPAGIRPGGAGGVAADPADFFRPPHPYPRPPGGAPHPGFRHHVQREGKRGAFSHQPRPRADRGEVGERARHRGPAPASARRAAAHMCSKYCLGTALGHPELTSNPYRPLLQRYFDPTPVPAAPAPLPALAPSAELATAIAA